ncbi:MAG: DUF1446 domain-containing protein [Candidatus Dormibacteria bacterium]
MGAGQGFYGDTPDGALAMIERGEVSHLCCDALSELTVAILEKDRRRDPGLGYARDLPLFARTLLEPARRKGVRWITNAGGINPAAGAAALARVACELGLPDLRIGIVSGDNLLDRLPTLAAQGLPHLDTGEPLSTEAARSVVAVAYLGAQPVVAALAGGADVVVTGRVADAALFLAPLVHELGWAWDDWDRLALGAVAGHLLECSGQSTGGNFSGGWWTIQGLDEIGYPIAEVSSAGELTITKPPGTGGRVDWQTVREQLLYEVTDPTAYVTPDVVVDLGEVELHDAGPDRVTVSGVRGRPRPERLKVVLGYLDGWAGTVSLTYSWPDAVAKADHAAELVARMAARAGVHPLEVRVERQGVDALHGTATPVPAESAEVGLRICARFASENEAARFGRLAMPLALNGPPHLGGGAPPQPARALLGIWPSLVARGPIEDAVQVRVVEAGAL